MSNSSTRGHAFKLSKHFSRVDCRAGPKIVFFDTKCAVGNGDCAVGIYLMCSSIISNEVVQHD